MNITEVIALIQKSGITAKTITWVIGLLQAMPAIKAGTEDLKTWLETGVSIGTEDEPSDNELNDMLTRLKAQAADTDAQVEADKSA